MLNGRCGICDLAWRDWIFGPAQRAEAFRELALAEADDPTDASAHPVDAPVLRYEVAVALPVAEADDAATEEDLLSKVGRGRIAHFGCPHCGRDDVRPWARLAASLGTAARAAGRHSTR